MGHYFAQNRKRIFQIGLFEAEKSQKNKPKMVLKTDLKKKI